MKAHPPDELLEAIPLLPEVERHLARCPKCRVHRRILSPGHTVVDAAPDPSPDLGEPAPETAAPWRRRWVAWDAVAGRRVAHVEPLHVTAAALQQLQRLEPHPHVIGILRVHEDPLLYCRESAAGERLNPEVLESDPRGMAWLAQSCSALTALHSQGIPHGYVSRHTVVISDEGRLQLVDAGLVPNATEADDWCALAVLFRAVAPQQMARLRSPDDPFSPVDLLAWLLTHRDPGARGGARYQDRGILGVGGMGEVQRVYDPVLDRIVARKVLSGNSLSCDKRIHRFLEEARITAQLQHPSVVPVHDLEHLANGAIAFTMRQMQGRTLGQVIRDVHDASPHAWGTAPEGWNLRRLVEALRRVCGAVAYAHSRGIVHLDIKPGNVMVGEYDEVLLFDWGLARQLDDDGLILLDRVSGTQGYMAPEQSQPEARVGPRADLFGLGAILFEILGRDPGGQGPRLARTPAELVSIATCATAADPAARYAAAQDLAADLACWQDGRPVRAHSYKVWERVGRRLWPHQVPIAVALVGLVLVSAVISVSWFRLRDATAQGQALLGQTLVDRANLAWDSSDRIRAEAYAAAAVGVAGRSEGRGLLARLARGWRPTLQDRWAQTCHDVVVTEAPIEVVCRTTKGLEGRSFAGDSLWSQPGVFRGLRRVADGYLVVAGDTVLTGSGGTLQIAAAGGSDLAAAAPLVEGMAMAAGTELTLPGASILFEEPVLALAQCGSQLVVSTQSRVFLVQGTRLHPLGADRPRGPLGCDPRGRMLAVTSGEQVQLWSLHPLTQRRILTGHLAPVVDLDWSPTGDLIATASEDGTVRIWDARRGTEIGRIPVPNRATSVAFTPDGQGLITTSPTQVRRWEIGVAGGVESFDVVVRVDALSWGSDSLFTLDHLGRPVGFDPQTGRQTHPLYTRVESFSPDPSSARVALVRRRGDFAVLDLEENLYSFEVDRAHVGGGTAVAWRPGTDMVVSGGRGGDVRAWDITKGSTWSMGLGTPIRELRWDSTGQTLVAATATELVYLDPESGAERLRLPGDIESFAVGPQGSDLAIGWGRGGLSLSLDVLGKDRHFEPLPVEGRVVGLSFSPTEPLLASVTRQGLVQVFHIETREELARLFAHPTGATDLSFAHGQPTLASSGTDGSIVLLDTRPLLDDSDTHEAAVSARYGITRRGTDLVVF